MSNSQSDHTQFRLPAGVKPSHYDLLIKTDLEKLEFQGIVTIEKITITTVSLTYPDGSTRQIHLENLTFNERIEQASLTLPTTLKGGSKAVLLIHYKCPLTDELKGYYYSKYEIKGQRLYYAVTQFEATAARRAFPCWDEPALKATFEISMISRDNTVNLSNMPVVSEAKVTSPSAVHFFEDDNFDGWKITEFERTPIMSTYIVALANGDFQYKESSYVSPLSGKSRPLRMVKFCLDVKAKALAQYEQAFDIEFILPKLDTLVDAQLSDTDQVHDFNAGAMENWGLIIGRTTASLVDPE
ncbi:hypothetical protein Clacol_004377 [Clathrus columnatus]|uniref:Aminopeptidase N n=1 Tax=Clathrus columnatus TaxID=1419009 RepID=A0AAV5AAU9_9AGAM|nr:hypothetical protein Clacol_004377 [Clathrus columnatus]